MPGNREKGLEQLSKGTPSCKVSMGSRQGDWRSLSISWGEVVSKGLWCYNLGAAPSSRAPRCPFLGGAQLVQRLVCCLATPVFREYFVSLWVLRTHGHSCPEAGWAAYPAVRSEAVLATQCGVRLRLSLPPHDKATTPLCPFDPGEMEVLREAEHTAFFLHRW